MSLEAKRIRGHGLGTNMDWLCVLHKSEGFGFGDEEAITCIDMTVHAPEQGPTWEEINANEMGLLEC